MTTAMDATIARIIDRLRDNYGCHSFILYGSRATGEETASSDYDVCAFRDQGEMERDCAHWEGIFLDAWVYPVERARNADEAMLALRNGRVLEERNGIASACIQSAKELFERGPRKLAAWDIEMRKTWVAKTLVRIERDDIESRYRRIWLLYSLLEYYFEFRDLWYLGPKESFKWLEQHDIPCREKFDEALQPGASLATIHKVAQHVLAIV